ncbi:hypothetical protein OMO38_19660 [Chryseobacterium sp. 09-1422]|uniref:Uncharacterized protein n=1 Tax=Chryseobacterium kimseyorum TaxID=2984028 RepID=A0ABT3I4J5_9FLAO|nr:hypothetical protein [Chryseobacterium kimseyorum]MCW3170753.1 hypothetical protein [Chryseobacterium kimseyorum]
MKPKFLISCLLFLSININAQKLNQAELEIKKNIEEIQNYTYTESPDLDIDGLCFLTAQKTVELLNKTKLTAGKAKTIGLEISANNEKFGITIGTFSYNSGGTRGNVSHPIIQWKNRDGKLFAYNLSSKINCNFMSIEPLKSKDRDQFLLFGMEKGNGACEQSMVYAIEIKNDFLIVDNPVFVNRPYLNLCNMNFDFDQKKQILYGSLMYDGADNRMKSNVEYEQGEYSKSKKHNDALLKLLKFGQKKDVKLKFDGTKFTGL